MKFDGSDIFIGDSVYDVSSNKGNGRVSALYENTFEVVFETKRKVTYNFLGVQKGGSYKTLYWSKPYILIPKKGQREWVAKQKLLDSIIQLMEDYNNKFGS